MEIIGVSPTHRHLHPTRSRIAKEESMEGMRTLNTGERLMAGDERSQKMNS